DLAVLDVAADELRHDGPDLLRPFPDRPTRLDQASNEVHEEPSDLAPEERQHGTEGTLDGVPRGGDAAEDGDGSCAQLTEGAPEALLRLPPPVHVAGQEVLGEPVHEETEATRTASTATSHALPTALAIVSQIGTNVCTSQSIAARAPSRIWSHA